MRLTTSSSGAATEKYFPRFWKYLVCLVILSFTMTNLLAQIYVPEDESEWQDEFTFRGERKSATTAIILSSIFPGSGHFYVNKRSIGTYIFPVIEIGLWAGYFYFNKQGQDIEKDYMAYADQNYRRWRQNEVQTNLIDNPQSSSIYNDLHFRLDEDNTQHFYEDIGKYNKYIFGWSDWYEIYFEYGVQWQFDNDGIWMGNYATHPDYSGTDYDPPYSALRQKYIGMRRDAQENFDKRTLVTFGLVFNRIISSLDVIRVTTIYNRELRYSSNLDFNLHPAFVNNQFTPMATASYKF